MNICYLQYSNPWNPFSPGGVGRVNHEVFKRLSRSHTVEVLTGCMKGMPSESKIDGVKYRQVGGYRSRIANRLYFSWMASNVDISSFDIVVIAWERYAPVRIKLCDKPVVLELHANFFDIPAKIGVLEPLARFLLVRALQKVKYITAVSRNVMGSVSNKSIHFRKAKVIYNGIGDDCFSKINAKANADYFLFLGRIDIKAKGIDTLLNAYLMAEMDVPLLIGGDGEDMGKLNEMIKNIGLEHRVNLLGWVDGKRKRELIEGCIAMCVPSRSEGFGLVAVEAMAMGKPVLASSIGGLSEIVENEISGLLFDAESEEQCAKAITRMAADSHLYASLKEGAYARARDFTLAASSASREDFFYGVLEDSQK